MTMRDLAWRVAGVMLIGLGCMPGIALPSDETALRAMLAIPGVLSVVVGLVLAINGKRVATALRVERSRHRHLPFIIHERRVRRGRR
jgi:hypothetical protein